MIAVAARMPCALIRGTRANPKMSSHPKTCNGIIARTDRRPETGFVDRLLMNKLDSEIALADSYNNLLAVCVDRHRKLHVAERRQFLRPTRGGRVQHNGRALRLRLRRMNCTITREFRVMPFQYRRPLIGAAKRNAGSAAKCERCTLMLTCFKKMRISGPGGGAAREMAGAGTTGTSISSSGGYVG